MIQELNPSASFSKGTRYPLHTIELRIFGNTSLATISSVLRATLNWAFLDREANRSPVLGITSVLIYKEATFTLGEPDRYGLFTPMSAGIRSIRFWGAIKDSELEPSKLETSIRTLSRLSPSPSAPAETAPRCTNSRSWRLHAKIRKM